MNFAAALTAHFFILVSHRAIHFFKQIYHVAIFVGAGVFFRHGISPFVEVAAGRGQQWLDQAKNYALKSQSQYLFINKFKGGD